VHMSGHRFFAAIYDRLMSGTEDAGLREMRAELIGEARGRTLELGAGTGLNLTHYGEAVTNLTVTEPDPFMARRLRARVDAEAPPGMTVEIVETPAEKLPFPDASFDTVVSTLVLCSVEDPDAASREIARVLRPEGRLLYLEHVRSEDPKSARWQDRLERPWGWFGAGCHPNRPTAETLVQAGFATEGLEHDKLPKAPPIVRPLIRGEAGIRVRGDSPETGV
jgi:ubiquinone/menaquinone biosynthesis C-methylase UbiE